MLNIVISMMGAIMKRITSASSQVSDKPAHQHSLARGFAARTFKVGDVYAGSGQNLEL